MSRTIRVVRVPLDNEPTVVDVDPVSDEFYSLIKDMDLDGIKGAYESHTGSIKWEGYIDAQSSEGDVNPVATMVAGRIGWDGAGHKVLCGPVVFFGTSAEVLDWEASFPQPLLELLRADSVI